MARGWDKRGGDLPGPARFFVAGPSQNDRLFFQSDVWVEGEGDHKGRPYGDGFASAGERASSRTPLRDGRRGIHPHPNLPPSRRPLRNPSISPIATPITLTLILSQDGRGDKRGKR